MSWYPMPKKAYADDRPTEKRKNQKKYMKKIRLPTQCKTVQCSMCGKSATIITVNNQKFKRCQEHIKQLNMRNEKYKVIFEKAKK